MFQNNTWVELPTDTDADGVNDKADDCPLTADKLRVSREGCASLAAQIFSDNERVSATNRNQNARVQSPRSQSSMPQNLRQPNTAARPSPATSPTTTQTNRLSMSQAIFSAPNLSSSSTRSSIQAAPAVTGPATIASAPQAASNIDCKGIAGAIDPRCNAIAAANSSVQNSPRPLPKPTAGRSQLNRQPITNAVANRPAINQPVQLLAPAAPAQFQPSKVIAEFQTLYFGEQSADLTGYSQTVLAQQAAQLRMNLQQNPGLAIAILGFAGAGELTTARGQTLASGRAETVFNFLAAYGLPTGRIYRAGAASSVANYGNTAVRGDPKQRRVEIKLWQM